MNHSPPEGFAVSCDSQGNILQVILDSSGFFNSGGSPGDFLEMASDVARQKLEKFFREISEKGIALCRDLPLSKSAKIINLMGLAREDIIYVLASRSPDQLFPLYDEMMGRFSEQSIMLRALHDKAQAVIGTQPPDSVALAEFMKVNNDLINTQRELIKSNHRQALQEERFRQIIQGNPDPVFILDGDGRVLFKNRAANDLANRFCPHLLDTDQFLPFSQNPPGEVTLNNGLDQVQVFDLLRVKTTWDEKPASLVSLRDVTARKGAEEALRILCEELEQRVNERTMTLKDANENLRKEIAERKKTEDALLKSELLFRRTFDFAPIGAAMVSLDSKFIRVNAELCRITGYTEQELIAIEVLKIIHPNDLGDDVEQTLLLEAGSINQYVMDKRYIRKDGNVAWVHISKRLIRDNIGRPQYYLPMVIDISERKRLEEELLQNNKTLEDGKLELEDMNSALRILLDQREKDRQILQNQVLTNMRLLIAPYLDRIRREVTGSSIERYVQTIERNFDDITSSFSRTLNSEYRTLTANEIRVADLIRAGQTSKDIAAMLKISVRTAEYYRKGIRRKLGLLGKKTNLYTYLGELVKT